MTCTKCTAETADGMALCERCGKTAGHALTNIAAYYADLDRVPTSTGFRRRSSSTAPDPTGLAAAVIGVDPVSAADAHVTNTLTTWARVLVDDRPGVGSPPTRVPQLAPWLAERIDSVSTLAWAGDLLRDLLLAERLLKRVAMRARVGNYLGTCGNLLRAETMHDGRTCACSCHLADPPFDCDIPGGCGAEYAVLEAQHCDQPLYAGREDRWVSCPCGATWDARARRQQLVRAIEDQLAPVAVIAHLAATITGEASVGRLEERIKKWTQRRKVEAVTTQVIDGRPRKVYRVGDVLDLLTDTPGNGAKTEPA